jgi:hypothetical protein
MADIDNIVPRTALDRVGPHRASPRQRLGVWGGCEPQRGKPTPRKGG